MKKLLEYGFSTTTNKVFYRPGDTITEIPVWYGREPSVVATVDKTFAITVNKNDGLAGVRVLARFDDPVMAPVNKGDKIGELVAEQNGRVIARAPMVAGESVRKIRFMGRVMQNIKVIFGWN